MPNPNREISKSRQGFQVTPDILAGGLGRGEKNR